MRTDDFIKELDEVVQTQWKEEIQPVAMNTSMTQGLFNINKEKTDEVLKRFITEDVRGISIRLSVGSRNAIVYCYAGIEIKPDTYWLRPEGRRKVSVLQIIEQAIIQNTWTPDIKFLQDPIEVQV